jgi:hypothetical protein
MNIIYSFRLTRILYKQVLRQGTGISAVLENWDEADYANLREYVRQCRSVVPKYVQKLSELVGRSPRDVINEITEAQAPTLGSVKKDQEAESMFMIYLPEDNADTSFYLSGFCKDRERPM